MFYICCYKYVKRLSNADVVVLFCQIKNKKSKKMGKIKLKQSINVFNSDMSYSDILKEVNEYRRTEQKF